MMTQVTISPKFQVVIPEDVRKQAKINRGEKVTVIYKDGIISLVPQRPLRSLKGMLKGVDARHIRQKRDRI